MGPLVERLVASGQAVTGALYKAIAGVDSSGNAVPFLMNSEGRLNATDFILEISKGNVTNHSEITRFGRNDDIDTATVPQDLWNGPTNLYVVPTAARIHAVVSTSTDDADAGTGAHSVRIFGLDSIDEITEDVTLDGTTPVNTTQSFIRVNRMRCLAAGSGGTNAGNITATAVTDSTVSAYIAAGAGTTLICHHSIPRNSSIYLMSADVNIWRQGGTAGAMAECDLMVREFIETDNPVLRIDQVKGVAVDGSSAPQTVWLPYKKIAGPADIFWRIVFVSDNNTAISGALNGVLVKS
jgi:hypothetical protein